MEGQGYREVHVKNRKEQKRTEKDVKDVKDVKLKTNQNIFI